MDVSIIIPSYDTQDTIEATLDQLQKQMPTTCETEVLVVDCSNHNEVERKVAGYDFVKFHREQTRFNPGIGRNIGANLASGKLLVFIDADVELGDGAINAAWQHYQQGAKIFGGALELNPRTSIGVASYIEHYYFNSESQAARPASDRKNLSSAFMCFDKQLFLTEGGFKDIPRMQDTELTEGLRAKGYALKFFPDMLGLQTQDSPLKKVLKKIYINGQNLYYIRYQRRANTLRKVAFAVALPVIMLVKIARIVGRHLVYQRPIDKLRTVALSPLLLICGGYWMMGFYQAMISESGISKARH